MIQEVSEKKVNLYFGKQECLDAVKTFIHKPLNRLSPEEDFMLGAYLGCDYMCTDVPIEVKGWLAEKAPWIKVKY